MNARSFCLAHCLALQRLGLMLFSFISDRADSHSLWRDRYTSKICHNQTLFEYCDRMTCRNQSMFFWGPGHSGSLSFVCCICFFFYSFTFYLTLARYCLCLCITLRSIAVYDKYDSRTMQINIFAFWHSSIINCVHVRAFRVSNSDHIEWFSVLIFLRCGRLVGKRHAINSSQVCAFFLPIHY